MRLNIKEAKKIIEFRIGNSSMNNIWTMISKEDLNNIKDIMEALKQENDELEQDWQAQFQTVKSCKTSIHYLSAKVDRLYQKNRAMRKAMEYFRTEIHVMTLPDNRIRMIVDKRIDETLAMMDTLVYHNPTDIALLKQVREALYNSISYPEGTPEYKECLEALQAIDKVVEE
jgi:predicted RNase H-like nuclease (RuvC/YqgF family)